MSKNKGNNNEKKNKKSMLLIGLSILICNSYSFGKYILGKKY